MRKIWNVVGVLRHPPLFFPRFWGRMGWVTSCLHLLASLFYGRWDPEKPCGTEWTSERVLQELFLKLGGPCRRCLPVSSTSSLLWRRAHPFHQFVYDAKYVKKSRKKIFLIKSRQFCTFMKVGGRYAARPQRTQTFSF
jgi:hypothetical protein